MNQEQKPKRTKNISIYKMFRRALRSNSTSAEATLWTILKGRQIGGLKFRRQYSIENNILDFYCVEIKLAIELDGDYHNQSLVDTHDYERDKFMENRYGIKTLRFENRVVFEQPEAIVQAILEAKHSTHSTHSTHPTHPSAPSEHLP